MRERVPVPMSNTRMMLVPMAHTQAVRKQVGMELALALPLPLRLVCRGVRMLSAPVRRRRG